jgi:hypothetical protein
MTSLGWYLYRANMRPCYVHHAVRRRMAGLSSCCAKLCLLHCSSHAGSSTPEALFLDMGAYKLAPQLQPTTAAGAPAAEAAAAGKDPCLPHSNSYSSSSSSPSSSKATGSAQQPSLWQLGTSAVAALLNSKSCSAAPARSAAGSTLTAASVQPQHQSVEQAAAGESATSCSNYEQQQQQQQQQQECGKELRVYQVLHPALVGRAHVFGNELQLREVQQVADLPFFDAPGEPAKH